ncbi:hypothetical protein B0H13DRAFT_1973430 [Mycena leptocephala]|nr:hypothetical protein B0H13DRAFT_1973430 [Mycena leptocephala]
MFPWLRCLTSFYTTTIVFLYCASTPPRPLPPPEDLCVGAADASVCHDTRRYRYVWHLDQPQAAQVGQHRDEVGEIWGPVLGR